MGFGKGLGCTGMCAKYILFLVNLAIFVCGAVVLGVGIGIRVSDTFKENFIEDTGIEEGALNNKLIVAAVYIMIGVGALLFVVGFFGCCGACKESNCMLTIYIILVTLLLLIQIAGMALVIVFRGEFDTTLETKMTESVQDKYGKETEKEITETWDDVQYSLECCGSRGPTDYEDSYFINISRYAVPVTCCTEAQVNDTGFYYINPQEYRKCSVGAVNGTGSAYHSKGCYEALTGWATKYTNIIIGVLVALGVIQIASICIGCCIKEKL